MKKIAIINGPNLNLLGTRETDIYGTQSFDDFYNILKEKYRQSIDFHFFQSNIEGEIIDEIHRCGFDFDMIILNPAGYSYTSYSIADAIKAIKTPVVEVHISNIFAREDFRQNSITAKNCVGVISGFGLEGYEIVLNSAKLC